MWEFTGHPCQEIIRRFGAPRFHLGTLRAREADGLSTPAPSDMARRFNGLAATWDAEFGPDSAHGPAVSARIAHLRTVCRDLGRPRVLDLGCATGWTLLHLQDAVEEGVGIDIAPEMIERARQNADRPHLRFSVGDAAEFCARHPEQFDLVLLIGVLAHLPDTATVLTGIKRVLARQGRLVVISPHPWNPVFCAMRLLERAGRMPPARHLTPWRLRAVAATHGLELATMDALPYSPWPALGFPNGRRRRSGTAGRTAGLLRGAFAATFRHAQRRHASDMLSAAGAGSSGGSSKALDGVP